MNIAINELRNKILETLNSKSFNDEDASVIADYLIWAEMSGNKTQGLIKMTGPVALQDIKAKYEPKIIRDTKLSQLIDAGANPAPLVTANGTKVAISKAKETGFGLVGIRNTFSSNGAQAYYAELIAREDLIGIVCSRSIASTTGFNSIDPLFGTNPIGFGFPTDHDPLVFDMATSAMTFYGLVLAKARSESIPNDMVIDKNGNPTTDPTEAMNGAILPFDHSYKGSGLGMMVEMLAGPLVDGAWVDNRTQSEEWGTLIIALDPNLLVDTDKFKKNASDMINAIKTSRVKAGDDEIRLPGERALKSRQEAEMSGSIDVEETILRELGYVQ